MRMRTGIAMFVMLLVGASAQADVKSQSVQMGGIGILTGVALARDGSSLIVKQTLGGPCVAHVAANAVETRCYGPAHELNGGLIAIADDGYVIYGSSFQRDESVESK